MELLQLYSVLTHLHKYSCCGHLREGVDQSAYWEWIQETKIGPTFNMSGGL